MKGNRGLGKGLSALFSETESDYGKSLIFEESEEQGGKGVTEVEIGSIFANPDQPRKAFDPTALQELADSIELYFEKKRIIYILGMLQNDEMDTVISRTVKHADMVLTVTPQYPQALHAYELAKEIATYQPNVTAVDSLEEAVEISFLLAGKDDVIVAFGTPVLQDRLREILKKSKKK